MSFRKDFYTHAINGGFELNAPGIYEWRIDGVGVYIGKALKLRSRIRAYPNNVRRMIAGLHWHSDPAREYRQIHKALRVAHDNGATVTVSVLENCHQDHRAEREHFWIAQRQAEAREGGLPVLNSGTWV